jgi:hypothetical protein
VATPSFLPVVLRNGVVVEDPLGAVLGLLKGPWHFNVSDPSRSASFGEADLKLANRGAPASQRPKSRRFSSGATRSSGHYGRSPSIRR